MAQDPSREIVELLLDAQSENSERSEKNREGSIVGVLVGVLAQYDGHGQGWVSFDKRSVDSPVAARALQPIGNDDIGCQVCLVFEQGDRARPIILGVMQQPQGKEIRKNKEQGLQRSAQAEAVIDGERIVLEGQKEIVLRCGKASITLTQDGKVLVRGAYLSSRSTGPNLIKGGSVQLN